MRIVVLLPLAAVAAVAAGCGSEGRESGARSVPQRDLTLAASAVHLEIASPVELRQLQTLHRTVRPTRRTPRPSSPIEPNPVPAAVAPAPALALPAADSVAQPANTASEPANDRELLPGKTVAVIPASSGPSTGSDWTDELPRARGGTMVVGGGGRCPRRGRGPGIGIAGAPRPDFR